MVTIKPKTVVSLRASGVYDLEGPINISVRDTKMIIDEPIERGGTNLGPSPTETLIASLIACTCRIASKCAKAHEVKLKKISVDAVAKMDRRGVEMKEEIDMPFPEIVLKINVITDADEAALEPVKRDLGRFCPVSKVIRRSGTKIIEEWNISKP
jgi:uncharacterized OsmC-like protein